MTKEELAAQITGREYPAEITKAEAETAKQDGLVVVFGASDDLMEFRGAIYDEVGCYDGGEALVDAQGLLPDRESIDDDDELQRFFARKPGAKLIEALWCDTDDLSWSFRTEIPHATFDILEDSDTYCRGIVFSLADLD